jgi:uncharacterized phiE125 gp8 family phage protein
MIASDPIVLPQQAVDDAKAYLRAGHGEEDALIGGLLRSAIELCEQFTGQVLIARTFRETIAAGAAWQRLGRTPVSAVAGVEALAADGTSAALLPAGYAVDIDASGDGWVRVLDAGGAPRVRVTLEAGMASGWSEIPDSLRQGALRLAGHLYARREAKEEGAPPAAVTVLWRPWRRMRLG